MSYFHQHLLNNQFRVSLPSMKNSNKLMKSFILLSFLISFTARANVLEFKMSLGRVVTAEYQKVKGAKETLVLLPGINRSLEMKSESKFFQAAADYKVNVLTIATSSHPRSISALGTNETPVFLENTMTLKDYAAEVEFVIAQLKIVKPFVASLSYSSAILNELDSKKFAGFIEMVPMGDPVEGADSLTKSARDYQDFLMLNPFMTGFVRSQRDSAYNSTWTKSVNARLEADPDFYGPNPRTDDIIAGYVSLARAAENFRLNRVEFPVRKHFILVDQEEEERFNLQLKAVQTENADFQGSMGFFIVAKSGHVLPSDQPQSTLKAVTLIMQMTRANKYQSGVIAGETFVEFTPAQRKELGLK